MAEDRIANALRKGAGHVQDAVGGLTGDTRAQAKGKLNETVGATQDAYGKIVDQAEDVFVQAKDQAESLLGEVEDIIRGRPLVAAGVAVVIGLVLGMVLRGGRKTVYVKR